MPTKRTLTRQLTDARAEIRRLAEKRQDATEAAGTGQFNTARLARQITEAREENEALRCRLADRPAAPVPDAWKAERSRLMQRLALSERARASLDAQLLEVGQVNERLARESYNRAVRAEVAR